MMKTVVCWSLLCILCLSGWHNPAAFSQERKRKLVWKGCGIARKAFLPECAEAYEKKTGIQIEIVGGGDYLGIRSTRSGNADLGGICRPLLPDIFPEQENGIYLTHIAWDAICFITHPTNPVQSITIEQARTILLGQTVNWKDLGGPAKPIVVIYRVQTGAGRFSGVGYMTRKFLFNDPYVDFKEKALYFRDSGLVERNVENIQWSFASDGISSARLRLVKVLTLDGTDCSKENIANGTYPFFRPLFFISRGKPAGELKKFLDWMVGAEAQAIISAQGTVNLREGHELKTKFKFWKRKDLILNY